MLATNDPNEAYRRSNFDARVHGSDTAALVALCLEQAIAGMGGALLADLRGDAPARGKSLSRALTAITALELGVDRSAALADALLQVYGAARRTVLDCATAFDRDRLEAARQDLTDIKAALERVRQS